MPLLMRNVGLVLGIFNGIMIGSVLMYAGLPNDALLFLGVSGSIIIVVILHYSGMTLDDRIAENQMLILQLRVEHETALQKKRTRAASGSEPQVVEQDYIAFEDPKKVTLH